MSNSHKRSTVVVRQHWLIVSLAVFGVFGIVLQMASAGTEAESGVNTYHERIALPPASDSRSARLSAGQRQESAGPQVPYKFLPDLDEPAFQRLDRYRVRASISDRDGELRFTADTVHPVEPGMLTTVGIGDAVLHGLDEISSNRLVGPGWLVENIDNGGIIDASHITLVFGGEGTLSGSSGCNRYTTAYRFSGEGLTVGAIAGTRKACVPALMNQEAKFLSILSSVSRFSFGKNGALTLTGAKGRTILARR